MSPNETIIQKWLGVITLVLRILLWPLRFLSQFVFPSGDFDGLSAPVTAKAAQQFVSYLRTLPPPSTTSSTAAGENGLSTLIEPWSTTGFAALQSDVAQTNSLVLIYLHSPLHREGQTFAQSVLLANTMVNFLKQPNLLCLGVSVHTAQGLQLAAMLAATSYPCLALLQPKHLGRTSSSGNNNNNSNNNNNTPPAMNLVFKAEGPLLLKLRPEQLVNYLNMTVTRHQVVLAEQEARRMVREQENQLRREQDEEYQQALLADQERERLVQEEAETKQRQEEEAAAAERAKQEAEEKRLQCAKNTLRDAPMSGGTRIRFNLPTGKKLDRRFYNDDTVGSLKAFLVLHFFEQTDETQHIKTIGLSTSFPKKTYDDDSQTMEEAGLAPQAVLMVQDMDA